MIGLHTVVHEFVVLFSTFPAKSPNISLDCIVGIHLKTFNVDVICKILSPCIVAMLTGA